MVGRIGKPIQYAEPTLLETPGTPTLAHTATEAAR
jgi:hypothetical protein